MRTLREVYLAALRGEPIPGEVVIRLVDAVEAVAKELGEDAADLADVACLPGCVEAITERKDELESMSDERIEDLEREAEDLAGEIERLKKEVADLEDQLTAARDAWSLPAVATYLLEKHAEIKNRETEHANEVRALRLNQKKPRRRA